MAKKAAEKPPKSVQPTHCAAISGSGSRPIFRLLCLWLCLLLFSARICAEQPLTYKINGLEEALEENATLYLQTLPDITPETFDDYRLEIRDALKKSLMALGYYQPAIRLMRTTSDKNTKSQGRVEITIDPGKPILVRSLAINLLGEAEQDRAFKRFIKQQPLKEGEVMHDGLYESLKSGLNDLTLNRGYFDAELTRHQVMVYPDQHAADIVLTLNTGRRYRFGPIIYDPAVTEATRTLLKRIVDFKKGEKFSSKKLSLLNIRLSATDYFKTIDIRPLTEQSQSGDIPIFIKVLPKTAWELETGIGFSTDEGPRLSLGIDKPWMNDKGHSLASNFKISRTVQELSGRYKIPDGNPLTDYYTLSGGYKRTVVKDTNSQLVSASLGKWKKRPGGWDRNLFLRLDYEDYVQGVQKSHNLLLIPGLSFDRRKVRGNPLNPRSGSLYNIKIETSAKAWLSDVNFVKVWGRGKWLTTIHKWHRLIARVEQGAIWVDDVEDIPPSIRFFTGGDQTIRGYSYESISPKDSSGQLMGGRYLSGASMEYDYEFRKNWRMALFVDGGTVTNNYRDSWEIGTGPGIRWISPLGPLKLDIAFAVSEPGSPWRIHFTMGPEL